MKRSTRPILIAAAIAAFVAATGAQAAERIVLASLGDASGKVMINQGQGYVAARSGMAVHEGDRVIALEGAAAQIVYQDGCVASLKERNLLPVSAGGCANLPLNPDGEAVKLAQAVGASAGKSDSPRSDKPPAELPANQKAWLQVAGGAGLIVAAGLFMNGVDEKPISGE